MTERPADLTPLETWLNTHPGTAHISTTTAHDLRRLVAAMLADAHEAGKREGAADVTARVEAVLRHWGSSEDMAAILIRAAIRSALDPNGGER